MGVDLAGIRDGLAANLATVDGLRVFKWAPGQVQLPAAVVLPSAEWVTRDQAMGRGLALVAWDIDLHVAMSSVVQAQQDLQDLVDDVVDALLSDKTLGGTGRDTQVPTVSGFSLTSLQGGEALTASLTVNVYAKDS